MRSKEHLVISLVNVFFILIFVRAASAEAPALNIQTMQSMYAGSVSDGTLLARGRINMAGDHCGFRIWSDEKQNIGKPEHYEMFGKNGLQNKLKFLINSEGSQPDAKNNQGILINTKGPSATFNIVADGDQEVQADTWELILHGAVFGCK